MPGHDDLRTNSPNGNLRYLPGAIIAMPDKSRHHDDCRGEPGIG
jgi:hypothetical protein